MSDEPAERRAAEPRWARIVDTVLFIMALPILLVLFVIDELVRQYRSRRLEGGGGEHD